ncbi:MAG: HPr-rel-A system PqqD family peptide chaperone [Chromatiaceae bacterium]|nr:HPr-rel-A system PqqD family peptide chaperone [Chromatiaceae bacterium]
MYSTAQLMWFCRHKSFVYDRLPKGDAVFDPLTGETHFLSVLPAMVLEAVNEAPQTTERIAHSLGDPADFDAAAMKKVADALRYLERAEIVESGYFP